MDTWTLKQVQGDAEATGGAQSFAGSD
jgi:hypothetical protein